MQIKGDPNGSARRCRGGSHPCSAANASAERERQRPAGTGELDRRPEEPAHRARDGQSHLAVPLRPRASCTRRTTSARRASRRRTPNCSTGSPPVHREGLVDQGHAPAHHAVARPISSRVRDDEANAKIDVRTITLWRFDRRRLDAESIRDTLLAVGGNLDPTPGGPHPFPAMSDLGLHAAQPVQGGLRHQPPQRLPDDAAHSAAPVPGPLRRRGHQRQHGRPHRPAPRRCRRCT